MDGQIGISAQMSGYRNWPRCGMPCIAAPEPKSRIDSVCSDLSFNNHKSSYQTGLAELTQYYRTQSSLTCMHPGVRSESIVDTLTTLAWSPQQNEILAGRVNEPMRLCHGQSAIRRRGWSLFCLAAPPSRFLLLPVRETDQNSPPMQDCHLWCFILRQVGATNYDLYITFVIHTKGFNLPVICISLSSLIRKLNFS